MTNRAAAPFLHLSPRASAGVDLRHYAVSSQEAFLFGHLDGTLTLAELADITGIGPETCLVALDRMAGLGLVLWPDDALPQRAPTPVEPTEKPGSDDEALLEPGDLHDAERRAILKLEKSIRDLNHWELLGVQPDTPASGLKKAFHHASKQYHPDRFFGKNLGSFRVRLERIFDAMRRAYDTLSDPEAAALYRQQHPPRGGPAATAPTPAPAPAPPQATPEARHAAEASQAELDAHRAALKAARKSRDKERLLPSLQGQTVRAAALVEQAERDTTAGRHVEAAGAFAAASAILPAKAEYALRAAHAYSMARDYTHAQTFADQAIAMNPKRKELLLFAADIAESASSIEQALRYLHLAASLDGEDPHVKHWIGRLTRK